MILIKIIYCSFMSCFMIFKVYLLNHECVSAFGRSACKPNDSLWFVASLDLGNHGKVSQEN